MASTIDNTKPLDNSLITSAELRALASAAKADIEALQGAIGGVVDGDKGDIVVSSSGTVWSLDINGTVAKITPVDADLIGIADSAASYSLAKLTFANLKTYLNTLYERSTNKDISGGYAGLTLFKINFKDVANTFTSFFTNSNTAARTYTFQDKDGTVALLSDVHDATSKTTPVDADELGLVDNAASNVLKKLTWANLKATLKAYFDTIYAVIPPTSSSWSPTISGMAIGNGTIDAKYIPNGKLIYWRVLITLGSTSSVSGAVTLTLPVTSVAVPSAIMPIGDGVIRDVSTFLSIVGKARWASTTTMALLFTDPATNALNDTSSTAPFTFATGDIFAFYGVYEAA